MQLTMNEMRGRMHRVAAAITLLKAQHDQTAPYQWLLEKVQWADIEWMVKQQMIARLERSGEYPALWQKIAFNVKRRAGWRCEHCGMAFTEGTNLAVTARNRNGKPTVLTVHHIDGNKANCCWANLLACCQRCHLIIQAQWGPGDPLPRLWAHAPQWMIARGLPYQPRQQLPLL